MTIIKTDCTDVWELAKRIAAVLESEQNDENGFLADRKTIHLIAGALIESEVDEEE